MAKIPLLTHEELAAFLRKEKFGFLLMAAMLCVPVFVWAGAVARSMYVPFYIADPRTLVIAKNDGFFDIGDKLKDIDAVPNPGRFKLYAIVSGKARTLKDGTYVLSGKYTIASLVGRLSQGPEDVVVTIPEGFTVADIDKRLTQFGLTPQGAFITEAQQVDDFLYPFLASDAVNSLEGYAFPDTYRFSQKATVREIADKMLSNFNLKAYANVGENVKSNPQALISTMTLASIVEKEANNPQDRRVIAGILWKRLENNMPLQVDATVVYAWKLRNPDWKPQDHALAASDLKIKSPYNTYANKGLPPGPISNPGWDAIDATLHPQDSDYWFYLSTRDGRTIFSRTIEEHNAAKAKYL